MRYNSAYFCDFDVLVPKQLDWFSFDYFSIAPFRFSWNWGPIWKNSCKTVIVTLSLSNLFIVLNWHWMLPLRWSFQEVSPKLIIERLTQYFKSSIDLPQRRFGFLLKYIKHTIHFKLPFINHIHSWATRKKMILRLDCLMSHIVCYSDNTFSFVIK